MSSKCLLSSTMHLFPNPVIKIEGVIRLSIELEAMIVLTSSSGLNSEYGS